MKKRLMSLFLLSGGILLASCSSKNIEYRYPEKVKGRYTMPSPDTEAEKKDTVFNRDLLTLKIGGKDNDEVKPESGKEEQSVRYQSQKTDSSVFLWQAAVNILSAYPLSSASKSGGLILTEWHNAEKPNEQQKITAVILPGTTEKDSLKIVVFSRVKAESGEWIEKGVDAKVAEILERDILLKMKQLKKAAK